MPTADQLRDRVRERYAALDLPSWPAPRDPMASPEESEYSRVTDPDRYLITHARARVWAEVLAELPGVTVTREEGVRALVAWERATGRTRTIRQEGEGAVPLLLVEVDGSGTGADALVPVLQVALAGTDGALLVATLPECGCDACDDGSDHYLEAIDDAVVRVLTEPVVLLRAPRWHADWSPSGWSCGGDGAGPDTDRTIELCRRLAEGEAADLPAGTQVVLSRPWDL